MSDEEVGAQDLDLATFGDEPRPEAGEVDVHTLGERPDAFFEAARTDVPEVVESRVARVRCPACGLVFVVEDSWNYAGGSQLGCLYCEAVLLCEGRRPGEEGPPDWWAWRAVEVRSHAEIAAAKSEEVEVVPLGTGPVVALRVGYSTGRGRRRGGSFVVLVSDLPPEHRADPVGVPSSELDKFLPAGASIMGWVGLDAGELALDAKERARRVAWAAG